MPTPADPGTPAILLSKGSLRALRGKGLVVPVRCPGPCSVDLSLISKKKTIARGTASRKTPGTAKVRLKAATKRLRRLRSLKATLRAVVKDAAGAKTTVMRSLQLR